MKTRPNEEAPRPATPAAEGQSGSSGAASGNASTAGGSGASNSGAGDKPGPGDALKIQAIAAPPVPPPQATQTSVPSAKIEAVRPPSLSLPKGGGAVRPMGDTFKTNPSTGTGSYAIPIPAPGARGFGPSLALSYDSGSGNGPFGLGWGLSLGAVSRRTDRRLPLYDDGGESDIFVLSGAEELVPEDLSPPDNPAEIYRTIRYRPRTEGGFARIEKRTLKATGETHWVVRSGDGGKRYYGRSPASRIFDPKDDRRVFSWLLDRAEDDRGNVLEVEYAPENLDNVDVYDCAESHRTMPHRGVAITNNRYPKRVRYGNVTMGVATLFPAAPAVTEALFEVVFDYGEHDEAAPSPEAAAGVTWPVRQDPSSSYRAGFEIRTYRLCRRVLVFHRFAELGEEPCLVSSVDFGYSESPAITLLQSATHRGYVRQPNGTYQSEALPALELGYSLPTRAPKTLAFDRTTLSDVDVKTIGQRAQWVDLDGEGLSGLLSREGGQLRYKHNLSGGMFTKAAPIATEPSIGAEQAHIADIDGNGIPTLVKMEGPLPGSFSREDGDFRSFRPFVELPTGIRWGSARVSLLDLNGDGRDDLLVVTDRYYIWYPSLGAEGFGDPYQIPITDSDDTGPSLWPGTPPHMGVFFADMTGDGQADLARRQ